MTGQKKRHASEWTMKAVMLVCLLFVCAVVPMGQAYAQAGRPLSAEEDCDHQRAGSLQSSYNQSSVAWQTAAMTAAEQAYREMKVTDLAGCMITLRTYFDWIKNILNASLLDPIAALLMGLMRTFLNYICEYVVNSINNLLEEICIPVPSLSFSFSLPSLTSKSCDGLSLLNLMSVNGAGTPFPSALPRLNVNGMSLGAETLMRRR